MSVPFRLVLGCILAFAGEASVVAQSASSTPRAALNLKQIVAHRGSSKDRPENTLAGTRRAIEAGATAVEVDVRLTKDGHLVIRHDDELERTTNGRGKVSESTLAELKELDAGLWFGVEFRGEKVPTLAEVLVLCKGKIDVLLDLKGTGADYARLVAEAVRKDGDESRTIVGVRSLEQVRQFRLSLPKARQLGLIAKPDEIEDYAAAGVQMIRLWPNWLSDRSLVGRVRKSKAQLHLNGTTGEATEVKALLVHEPDSLSSDDPGRLLQTLEAFARPMATDSLATIAGQLSLPGLKQPVEIARDQWGVPHIYAQTADDLFFAQGFVAAQDRLFQIDLWRRQGVGELSEVLGPSALEADQFARTIRYRGNMDDEWTSYSPDTKAIARAFTAGINACIDQLGDNLPLEFKLLNYRPKKWVPEDILGRSSGIYMSQNFRNEVQRLQLIKQVGLEKAKWLAPIDPPRDYELQLTEQESAHFPEKLLQGYEAFTKTLSFLPAPSESNNWVVSAARSKSGFPLLASDPHRAIALPSLRYLVHLHAPGWNVIGAGEPGLPGVALGHNERIAWGLTIIGADTADIVVEELDPANANEYAAGDGFVPFQTYEERIVVRGQKEPTKFTVKHSRHGPIFYEDVAQQRAYALQWIGNQPGGAAYLNALSVARAQNKAEFLQAIAAWRVPGLNFVYADVDKHIGWIAATHYPIRADQHSGLLPVPGKSGAKWQGFLTLKDYPQQFDPPPGQLVTANHNILPTGYAHQVGNEFAAPYRFERLQTLLNSQSQWKLDEFRALQQDSASLSATSLAKLLGTVQLDTADRQAASILLDWDGNLSVDSPAGSLFALWQRELQTALFQRQVPPEQVKVLNALTGTPAMIAALTTADARWFGNQPSLERDQLVRESFARAVKQWQRLPAEQRSRWGALHQVTFRHPLTNFGPVTARLLNLGPFERPGDGTTPNNTRYDDQFQQIHGASYRQLFDLADWDLGLATSAPGQSGQAGSPHYGDLAKDWSQGEYFPLAYSRAKVDAVTRHKLSLVPANQ